MKEEKVFVEEYCENEELQENEFNLNVRKHRSKNRNWIKICEFESERHALKYIENENIWKKCLTNKTLDGEKVEYRCKHGQYRKNECPAKIYLLYHATNEAVSAYSTECEHDHSEESVRGLDDNIKKFVENLFQIGIEKPNAVLVAIRNEKLTEPPKAKLVTFLRQLRSKKYNTFEKYDAPTISGYELKKWCDERSHLPDCKDSAFVLDHSIMCQSLNENDQDIKIVISTIRLLENLTKSKMVQIDATCKLMWQGYPVMIIGTSDKNKVFHPLAISVCKAEKEDDFYFIFEALRKYDSRWQPKILLADENTAITKGFVKAFGSPDMRIMCFNHTLKNIENKLRGIADANQIKSDIGLLQNCENEIAFSKASKLFVEKWRKKEEQEINEFLNYFEEQWLQMNPNWYEGASSGFPSTNNGIEATNALIKKEHTLRERLPVAQFLNKLHDLLMKWSTGRDPAAANCQQFALQTTVNLKEWTDAYHWTLLNKSILNVEGKYYTCSSRLDTNITIELLDRYRTLDGNWKTFEEFIDIRFGVWVITINEDLQQCSCSCPTFNKNYKCKHSLGLQIRLCLTEVPAEAKLIPLGQKRKRGRGRSGKAKKALIVQ